jgi:hypothetical protein
MAGPLIPIIQKSFDFNVTLYGYVDKFPRAHKALLGREILRLALELVVLLVTANHRANKVPELQQSSARLDALRITLRLAKRLAFLSNKSYEVLSQDLIEIGRMLGGWLKQSAGRMAEDVSGDFSENTAQQKEDAGRRKGQAVRYTMTSPKVEAYLKAKLEQPEKIVLVKTGVFYKTFFEDAMFCHNRLRLQVHNLAAPSEAVAIPSCGFPVTVLEKYAARLAELGRSIYVINS